MCPAMCVAGRETERLNTLASECIRTLRWLCSTVLVLPVVPEVLNP